METSLKGRRSLKKKLLHLLKQNDLAGAREEVSRFSRLRAINILFPLLLSVEDNVKWGAVEIMGALVGDLADTDMEAARTVIRRLMWNLNDESGGIGWGSPEAMAEILSRHKGLAKEYSHILISYAMGKGNYLEMEVLQRGLLWGIERLAMAWYDLAAPAAPFIAPYLKSGDAIVRALAANLVGVFKIAEARHELQRLLGDETQVRIREGGSFSVYKVKNLAAKALERLPATEAETQPIQ